MTLKRVADLPFLERDSMQIWHLLMPRSIHLCEPRDLDLSDLLEDVSRLGQLDFVFLRRMTHW
ncbi:MAG TPA: hypothetical protein DGU45_05280, partial [Planctomycetes bacterium]|nr:hypothetical protein [Planctomycetota bacterium]